MTLDALLNVADADSFLNNIRSFKRSWDPLGIVLDEVNRKPYSLGRLLFFDDARIAREAGMLRKLAHLEEPLADVYRMIWKYSSEHSDSQLESGKDVTSRANQMRRYVEGLDNDKLDVVLERMVPESFALVYRACELLEDDDDSDWGIVPHPVQLLGGLAMRATGKYSPNTIIDMKTGEGKTITSTFPVFLHALTGRGVHVMTHNDALAARDVEDLAPLYDLLDISTALVDPNKRNHRSLRDEVNDADVVYGALHQFGFSAMADERERFAGRRLLREPYFALVDEADSVMIDDATTPMVLNNDTGLNLPYASEDVVDSIRRARCVARQLDVYHKNARTRDLNVLRRQRGADAVFDRKKESLALNDSAYEKIQHAFNLSDEELFGGSDVEARLRNAVRAGLLEQGRDYDIGDHEMLQRLGYNTPLLGPQIVLIDENRHRPLPGQKLQDGLHQAIEAKHEQGGVRISRESMSVESLEIQQFLKRYPRLAGMTGTGLSAKKEFRDLYGCQVFAIPRDDEDRRVSFGPQLYASKECELEAVAGFVQTLYDPEESLRFLNEQLCACAKWEGRDLSEKERDDLGYAATTISNRPILIGTSSVEQTQRLEELIRERIGTNARIQLLNADPEHIAKENEIIANAGQPNTVTIATNMAGRGIDIKLDDDVRALGGLFVIATEAGLSERVEEQLVGRCGRQGDPGAYKAFMSLDDHVFAFLPKHVRHGLLDRFGAEKTKYRVVIEPKDDGTEEPIELYLTEDELKSLDDLTMKGEPELAADPRDIAGCLQGKQVARALKRARESAERHFVDQRKNLARTGSLIESYRKEHVLRRNSLLGEVVERDPYRSVPYHERIDGFDRDGKPQVVCDLVDAVGAYVGQLRKWADRLQGTQFAAHDMKPQVMLRDASTDRLQELERIADDICQVGFDPLALKALSTGDLDLLRDRIAKYDERAAKRGDVVGQEDALLEKFQSAKFMSGLAHAVIDDVESYLTESIQSAYDRLVSVYGQDHAEEFVRQSLLDEYDASWKLKLRKAEEWKSTARVDQQSFEIKPEHVLDLARNMDEIEGVSAGRILSRVQEYASSAVERKAILDSGFFASVPKLEEVVVEDGCEVPTYVPDAVPLKRSGFWYKVGAGLSAAALASIVFMQALMPLWQKGSSDHDDPAVNVEQIDQSEPMAEQQADMPNDLRQRYGLSVFDGLVRRELASSVREQREQLLSIISREYERVLRANAQLDNLAERDGSDEPRVREQMRADFGAFEYGSVRVEDGRFVYGAGPNVRVDGPSVSLEPDVDVIKRLTIGEIVDRPDLAAFAKYVGTVGYAGELPIVDSVRAGIVPVDAFEIEYEYAESYDLNEDESFTRTRVVRNGSVLDGLDRDLADSRRLASASLGVLERDEQWTYEQGPVLISKDANMYEVAFWYAMQVFAPSTVDAMNGGMSVDRAIEVQLSAAHAFADQVTDDYRGHLIMQRRSDDEGWFRRAADQVDRAYSRQWFARGPFWRGGIEDSVVDGVLFPRNASHRVDKPDSCDELVVRYNRALDAYR